MSDIVAVGELLIDFAQRSSDRGGYPLLQAQPGGAPANFLMAATRYGHTGHMLAKVGDDAFGRLLIGTLEDAGIDAGGVISDSRYFTTLAFVTLDENGDRSFSFARKPGADTQLRYDEIDLKKLKSRDVFHFGTLSMTSQTGLEMTMDCLRYVTDRDKLISFDPNLRLPLWDNEEDARAAMARGLNWSDVVKISLDEIDFFFGKEEGSDIERARRGRDRILKDYPVRLVHVTMGDKGCYSSNKNADCFVNVPEGLSVIDTTGAGDIFGGAAMAMLLRKGYTDKESLSSVAGRELKEIVSFAVTAASLSATRPGGMPSVPDEREVLAILK